MKETLKFLRIRPTPPYRIDGLNPAPRIGWYKGGPRADRYKWSYNHYK